MAPRYIYGENSSILNCNEVIVSTLAINTTEIYRIAKLRIHLKEYIFQVTVHS
jgi:hypothetical protein